VSNEWTDEQLGAALAQLRTAVTYPPTPPLAARVRQRLAADADPSRRLRLFRAWYVVAALVILTAMVALVWPGAREAVAERLGLRGVRVTYVPALSPSPPRVDPRPSLGTAVDLDAARAHVAFSVLVPALGDLGPPDEVYLNRAAPGGEVTLLYAPRPGFPDAAGTGLGLLISQTPGASVGPSYEKGAGPGTQVRSVRVRGQPGLWIEGAPHHFTYVGPGGAGRVGEARLAANVLVWEQDGLTVRIEGALTLEMALRIADSLR
jgi:hypothetical protein